MGQQSFILTDGTTDVVVKTTSPAASDGGLVVRPIQNFTGATGSAIPTSAVLLGASDGTNLQQLLVESATNRNLRVAIFNGATEASITATGTAAGNALQTLPGQYNSSLPTLTSGQASFVQLDGYGRLITVGSGNYNNASVGTNAAPIPTSSTLFGGSDGTNLRPVAVNSNGVQFTATIAEAVLEGRIPTTGVAKTVNGYISTNAITEASVLATTYTEQTSGAQRSFKSTSTSDTNTAGIGARTILLTYYTLASGAVTGPFTETITLNGTTAVNTVATNIALVESIEVITVGSNNSNVGTINMYTTTAGGGSIFASIAIGDRITYFAQHYVPTGSTAYITQLSAASTAGSSNVPDFYIRTLDYSTTNAAERVLIGNFLVQGSSNGNVRTFSVPLKVVGPARIVGYVTPANAPKQFNYIDFSFYEF